MIDSRGPIIEAKTVRAVSETLQNLQNERWQGPKQNGGKGRAALM